MIRNLNYFWRSFGYFISTLFKRRRQYDVIFYYPSHFNRGNNKKNVYFEQLIETCRLYKLSFLVFEEPDYRSYYARNRNSIPFDFVFLLVVIFRKFFFLDDTYISSDQKIGRIMSNLFFARITSMNVVTISQSMISFFRGIYPNAQIFDIQHGVIHSKKESYLKNGKVSLAVRDNNLKVLLTGDTFRKILENGDISGYYKQNLSVIGSTVRIPNINHDSFNRNILITLQFTSDHSDEQNLILLNELIHFISSNNNDIFFYLKHHPRFDNQVDLSRVLSFPNVKIAPNDINDCFKLCSLHATAYSTSTFEAALLGIPTVIFTKVSEFNFIKTEFNYPIDYSIENFEDNELYKDSSETIKQWVNQYYHLFDRKKFISLLE